MPRTKRLFFDIETVPDHNRRSLIESDLEPLPQQLPPTPISKMEAIQDVLGWPIPKIASYLESVNPDEIWVRELESEEQSGKARSGVLNGIERLRNRYHVLVDAEKQRNKLLSVTPEYCSVVSLGWAFDSEKPEAKTIGHSVLSERELLQTFWNLVDQAAVVIGYNVLAFDLPVMLIRSALLSVPYSRKFDLSPWGDDVVDLMKKRFPTGKAMGLKKLAKLYGLRVPVSGVDGSQVSELSPELIEEYCKSDVEVTRELYCFYRGYLC